MISRKHTGEDHDSTDSPYLGQKPKLDERALLPPETLNKSCIHNQHHSLDSTTPANELQTWSSAYELVFTAMTETLGGLS